MLCAKLHDDSGSARSLLLWNPAIGDVRQVPETENDLGYYSIGFGFSPAINDYKIVRLYHSEFHDKNRGPVNRLQNLVNRVEVYSLRTGSWKELECGLIQGAIVEPKAVTVNGNLFWLGSADEHSLFTVVSFDIAMEMFTLIPIPSGPVTTNLTELSVYQNKLAVFHCQYKVATLVSSKSSVMSLWVTEEGTGASGKSWSWSEHYSIGPISCFLVPICIWGNELLCHKMLSKSEGKVEDEPTFHMLNLTTNELKEFHIFSSAHDCRGIFNYEASLVSVCNN